MTTTIDKAQSSNGGGAVAKTSWDPFGELENLFSRLAPRRFGWPALWNEIDGIDFTPAADIEETDNDWRIEIELPGVKKDDIEVEAHGRTIVISGERKDKERSGVMRQRRRVTGTFRYEVTLPGEFDVDAIVASLDDGELSVSIPKAEAEQTRKVAIS